MQHQYAHSPAVRLHINVANTVCSGSDMLKYEKGLKEGQKLVCNSPICLFCKKR